jgi:hypothetical protein
MKRNLYLFFLFLFSFQLAAGNEMPYRTDFSLDEVKGITIQFFSISNVKIASSVLGSYEHLLDFVSAGETKKRWISDLSWNPGGSAKKILPGFSDSLGKTPGLGEFGLSLLEFLSSKKSTWSRLNQAEKIFLSLLSTCFEKAKEPTDDFVSHLNDLYNGQRKYFKRDFFEARQFYDSYEGEGKKLFPFGSTPNHPIEFGVFL